MRYWLRLSWRCTWHLDLLAFEAGWLDTCWLIFLGVDPSSRRYMGPATSSSICRRLSSAKMRWISGSWRHRMLQQPLGSKRRTAVETAAARARKVWSTILWCDGVLNLEIVSSTVIIWSTCVNLSSSPPSLSSLTSRGSAYYGCKDDPTGLQ